MKKILFVSTRNPYSGRFSGDVIRSFKIINILKKKNKVDVLYLGEKTKLNTKKNLLLNFEHPNFFLKIFFCIVSLFKFEPMQFGLFYSSKLKKHIHENYHKYDVIFFYHIRSSQYCPESFKGKTIIEIGDLYSKNYSQTYKNLSIFNPLSYLYLLESFLIKKIENKILNKFDKVILFSKKEISEIKKDLKKNVFYIPESVNKIDKKYRFSKDNFKILFIGNLNYLPNKLACYDFVKNVLPLISINDQKIEFHIIGKIGKLDKLLLSLNPKVKIFGQQKSLKNYIKKSICGLANLKIATGVQGKVLTYMSYGLPVICSEKAQHNFRSNVLKSTSPKELSRNILMLKNNKFKSEIYSRKSISFIKKFQSKKINLKYLEIV